MNSSRALVASAAVIILLALNHIVSAKDVAASDAVASSIDNGIAPTILWVADQGGVIRVITQDGATQFELEDGTKPDAIAVDRVSAEIWVAGEGYVRVYTANGLFRAMWELPTDGKVSALAIDATGGAAWLSAGNEVFRIDRDTGIAGHVELGEAVTVLTAFDEDEIAYVATGNTIYRLDAGMSVTVHAQSPEPIEPRMLEADGNAIWWLAGHTLYRSAGSDVHAVSTLPSNEKGVAISPDGADGLWMASLHSLSHVDATGTISGTALDPVSNSKGGKNGLGRVFDIAADPLDGGVWVAFNHLLRKFSASGSLLVERDFRGQSNGGRIEAITLYADLIAPSIHIVSPTQGSYISSDRPLLELEYSDVGAGLLPETVAMQANDADLPMGCDTDVAEAECQPLQPLAEGENTLQASITDLAGNTGKSSLHRFTVDTIPPVIDFISPQNDGITNQPRITISGSVNEPAELELDSETVALDAERRFLVDVELQEGVNRFAFTAVDRADNTATVEFTMMLDTVPPVMPAQESINIEFENGIAQVTGASGSAEPGSLLVIRNERTGEEVRVRVNADGSFSAQIAAEAGDTLSIFSEDAAGNISDTVEMPIGSRLPPDPISIAPPVPDNIFTPFHERISFLYEHSNPVQTDVTPGAINPERAAVYRGRVVTREGAPLSGVRVTVVGHPDVGQTLTRQDGRYDIVANGRTAVALEFSKQGYLSSQRKHHLLAGQFKELDDVALIPLDDKSTTIQLHSPIAQLAAGTEMQDADGTRTARVLFPEGVGANLVMPDGSRQSMSELTFRATEYTVGENGPEAMPGTLPPIVAYTYAVELSADEAIAAGAKSVEFDKPVQLYVDNFIGFPVGTIVPVGWYDREKAAWVAARNGRVIQVFGWDDEEDFPLIDFDGDGEPEDYGFYEEDESPVRSSVSSFRKLVEDNPVGAVFWFVEIDHFTPIDLNWSFLMPDVPIDPPVQEVSDYQTDQDLESNDSTECDGCVIEAENRIVRETVSLPGTPMSLNYSTAYQEGYTEASIPFNGARFIHEQAFFDDPTQNVFSSGQFVALEVKGVEVDRRNLSDNTIGSEILLQWDGLDAYGREVYGPRWAKIVYGDRINVCYSYFSSLLGEEIAERIFGAPVDRGMEGCRTRDGVVLYRRRSRPVLLNFKSRIVNTIGNWGLSERHSYVSERGQLTRGDGTKTSIIPTGRPNRRWQIVDRKQDVADGVPVFEAIGENISDVDMGTVDTISHTLDEKMLLSCKDEECGGKIYGVDDEGKIHVYADVGGRSGGTYRLLRGNDGLLYSILNYDGYEYLARIRSPEDFDVFIDGERALEISNDINSEWYNDIEEGAHLSSIFPGSYAIAVDADGRIYIGTRRGEIWVASQDDRINLWASGFGIIEALEIDVNGDIYVGVSDREDRVYRISSAGREAWVGRPADGFSPKFIVENFHLREMRVASPGKLVIHRTSNSSFWSPGFHALESFGLDHGHQAITDLSYQESCGTSDERTGETGFSSDLCFGTSLHLQGIDTDGNVIAYSDSPVVIRKDITPPPEAVNYIRDSERPYVYSFDKYGKHLETLDPVTARVIHEFRYNDDNELVSIVDKWGNATSFEKSEAGWRITSPDGQVTTVYLNDIEQVGEIELPGNVSWKFEYTDDGLLTSARKPGGATSYYSYNEFGKLVSDIWPNSGGWSVTGAGDGNTRFHEFESAMGRTSRFTRYSGPGFGWGLPKYTVREKRGPNGTLQRMILRDGIVETTEADVSVATNRRASSVFAIGFPRSSTTTQSGTIGQVEKISISTKGGGNSHPNGLSEWRSDRSYHALDEGGDTLSRTYSRIYRPTERIWTDLSPSGRAAQTYLNFDLIPERIERDGFAPLNYAYDSRGRVSTLTRGENESARTTAFTYHPAGSHQSGYLAGVTDALDRTVQYEYDPAGRISSQLMPDGREIRYEYDANDNLVSITPPGRPAHRFTHTVMDQQGSYVPPALDGNEVATHYLYNLDKQLELITLPDGKSIDYLYGQTTGQLDAIVIPTGSYQFGYHADTGRLATLTAPGGQHLGYTYDGFLLTDVESTGEITGNVSFSYDYNFWRRGVSVNGEPVAYDYDLDGLMTAAGDLAMAREGASGLLDTTSLGLITTDNDTNAFGELDDFTAAVSGSDVYSVDYQRDKLGRIVTKTETIDGVTTTYDYTYDLAGRLDTVTENGILKKDYEYDSNGNRTHVNGMQVGTYDNQDRLLSFTPSPLAGEGWGEGVITYDYTANGDLTAKHQSGVTTTFDYDVLGNLRSVTLPGDVQIDYIIDGQNRRIGKKVNGSLVQGFLYQDQLNPVAELDGSGNVVARFVYADKPNVPAYMTKNGATYRIISDHLGSPRLVIDTTTGAIAQRIDYDEWGNVLIDTNPGFQPFGFAGGIYDQHTGLVRFGARDYDPEIGRWTAKDPIGLSGGINVYSYAYNDSINFIDPSGLYGLAGAAYGAISGGIGGYITGGWAGAAVGAVAGAAVGAVMPAAASAAGTAAASFVGNATASLLGQGAGNLLSGKDALSSCNYNLGAAIGAGLGGAVGGPLGNYGGKLLDPIRFNQIGLQVGKSGLSTANQQGAASLVEGAAVGAGELIGRGY